MPEDKSQNGRATRRIAAIDLGTNSFHAVIVDIYPDGSFSTVDALKEMIFLGKDGVGRMLSHSEMDLGIDTLKKIKTLCVHQNVENILAYATSAIREAENGGVFIQRAIDEVQIKIMAIPGIKEAELVAYAVQHGMQLGNTPHLIMDIGGGSTEFIIADNKEIFFKDSKKLGVSRMTADYLKHDPVTKSEIRLLSTYYHKRLADIRMGMELYPADVLIGSSGTMQNIASMIAAMKHLSTSVTLNEFEYSAEDFFRFYDSFIRLNKKKRLDVPGLDTKRADFIVAGMILVKKVLEEFKISRIKTSVQAMREGIIVSYIRQEMKNLQLLADYPDTRRRSVFELLRKCRWHELHSSHVSNLALKLFDQTIKWHKLGYREKELLEYSALLHDIGYHISHRKHHKHSLYIILNADLKGFSQDEIEIMAHVSRYHRRSTPKNRHQLYSELTSSQKKLVKTLSGFLRVADGLDRSHYQNVTDLRVEIGSNVRIYIKTIADPELEIWGALRKKELFEVIFGKKLEIIPVDILEPKGKRGGSEK
ncbi:MAG: Ppx/GppA family phosphatase [Rhodothermaceae bacterium]|nr:Ppx/GppA family phosphatase [Rhodothermaceae bacterium]